MWQSLYIVDNLLQIKVFLDNYYNYISKALKGIVRTYEGLCNGHTILQYL